MDGGKCSRAREYGEDALHQAPTSVTCIGTEVGERGEKQGSWQH